MKDTALPVEAEIQLHIFRKCLPLQVCLQEIIRVLGPSDDLDCLDIGDDNGMISYHLRKHGGKWSSAVAGRESADVVRQFLSENVVPMEDGTLPFEKKAFDCVVVVSALERFANDSAFIEECHRVLKPDGRLVVNVSRTKPASLVNFLRRLLGVTYQRKGRVRGGYTESELFTILKDGFDVHNMRSYSRFFTELVEAIVDRFAQGVRGQGAEKDRRLKRIFSVAGPFYRLAFQLDMLLFFNRGHRLIATAKRRSWRPRKAPILVDGRSITEAVLSRPGI